MMRPISVRAAALSMSVAALVAAVHPGAAATTQSLGTPSDQPCPAKLTQSNHTPPPFAWSATFKCRVSAHATLNGVSTSMTGTVVASYGPWTTTTGEACASGSTFTTTITFSYRDKAGTIRFSAPMQVMGGTVSGSNLPPQQWCFSQYNRSYQRPNNVRVTGTGAYAPLDELCGFGLGVRSDARGGSAYFNVDDQFGTANQCYTFAA